MLEDFLSKLGASTKITVGCSISPIVGLEMIEVDRLTGTVNNYSRRPLEYNHSTREISNYDQFKSALSELFNELHISPKSNIILSLPNVHFGMINLPILLTDEAITNAIISEVEQSYIFKRQEPIVSWTEIYSNINTENRVLAYSAIQKDAFDKIIEACKDIGCTLLGIENSYSSLLKALDFSGVAKNQMKENVTWNLMVIGQNSYSIISMLGKKIMEYYEEPLALKSFVNDEIYNAIATSAQLTLVGLPANHLFIVSETDLVSAEVLSIKISVESAVSFLECNKYVQNELLPVNLNILPKLALQITPEAIGSAVYPFSDFPLKLNILDQKDGTSNYLSDISACPRINIGNLEIELTPAFIKRMAIIVAGIVIIPIIILNLVISKVVTPKEQAKLDEINAKFEKTTKDIKQYTDNDKASTFDIKTVTETIVSQNKSKLVYYSALGMSIPNKLWVTYYALSDAGKIDIKGKSNDVQSIYTFYKNLKQLVNNSDVRLYKLEVASESIDDVVADVSNSSKAYDFEITNMTEDELNPKTDTADSSSTSDSTSQTTENQLGKPLFGGSKGNSTEATGTTTTPATTPAATPATTTTTTTDGGAKLPDNLQKIEKF